MKYYFYEREDGSVFECQAGEADFVLRDPNRRLKLIGVSDGSEYRRVMATWKRSKKIYKTDDDELVDQERIEKLKKEAFAAELGVARGNIERPPDNSIAGDSEAIALLKQSKGLR